MKQQEGMSLVQVVVVIVIILAIVCVAWNFLKQSYVIEKFKMIKTDMLLIQSKIKVISNEVEMKAKGAQYIGTELSKMKENEEIKKMIEQEIIVEDKKKNKYYVLEKADIEKLGLNTIKLETGYYIVDYKTSEIIYTNGIEDNNQNVYYKLSDMEKVEI